MSAVCTECNFETMIQIIKKYKLIKLPIWFAVNTQNRPVQCSAVRWNEMLKLGILASYSRERKFLGIRLFEIFTGSLSSNLKRLPSGVKLILRRFS